MKNLRITNLLIATLFTVAYGSNGLSAEPPKKPLKVYILAGQSNMVGMASATTLEHIKLLPDSANEFKDMFDKDGKPVVIDDVWVAFGERNGKLAPHFGGANKRVNIGPEYAFGIYMHKALQEPILLIKAAYGGKSLYFDFRPPSAGEWTPPPGHPDRVKEEHVRLPIPNKLDLPADYVPGEEYLPKGNRRLGDYMGIRPMQGVSIGEINGVYPIYIAQAPTEKLDGNPFQVGDIILGVNGQGLRKDSIDHWREAFFAEFGQDWLLNVTRWRKGKIETFDLDMSFRLEDGRAGIEKAKEESKKRTLAAQENKGLYYRMMIEEVQKTLGDIKSVYPDYNPEQGYEIAGFVWFQGWNDLVDEYAYPNREKPGGFEQYSWLLKHLIRDVRKDLKVPDLPFVIGAMGVGGYQETPLNRFGHLQQAMAAPAQDPEFKGTVATVQAGKYWDHQLEEIINRSAEITEYKQFLQREKGLEGDALEKAYAEYRASKMTPLEEEILQKGKSDKAFHYMGSAKILSGIGKGFAEAMLKLEEKAE